MTRRPHRPTAAPFTAWNMLVCALALGLLTAGKPALAIDYYVPTQYLTIQAAVDAVPAGSRVVVLSDEQNTPPGPYAGFRYYGKAITVISQSGPAVTTINGVVYFWDAETTSSTLSGFTLTGPSYLIRISSTSTGTASGTVENCVLKGGSSGGIKLSGSGGPTFRKLEIYSCGAGIEIWHTAHPTITDCMMYQNSYGISANNTCSPTIVRCTFHSNTARGIDFGASSPGVLRVDNSVIYNNATEGILVNNGTTAYITNCVVHGSGAEGIQLNQNSSSTIKNVIVTSGQSYGIYGFTGATATVTYSDVYQNTGGNYGGTVAAGTGCISSDPRYMVDTNYQLQLGSPCIDAGDPSINDNSIPPGRGAPRSDMGGYGGAQNSWLTWCTAPSIPTPTSPTCGSTLPQGTANVTTTCSTSSNATAYEWELFTNIDCSGTPAQTFRTLNPTWTWTGLAAGSYAWHVRGIDGGNPSGCFPLVRSTYSNCCSFIIPVPCLTPGIPDPVSPTCGWVAPAGTTDVTTVCTAATNATSYQWELFSGSSCTGMAIQSGTTSGTSKTWTGLTAGAYSWHVRAANNNNPPGCNPEAVSSYSTCCAFSIPLPCVIPGTPDPVSPACGWVAPAGTTEVTTVCSTASNATSYQWELFSGSSCTGSPLQTGTTTIPNRTWTGLTGGIYSWHVRAANNNNPPGCNPEAVSSYSTCCAFSIPLPCVIPGTPDPVSPACGWVAPAGTTEVTTVCSTASNATSYQWELFSGSSCAGNAIQSGSTTGTNRTWMGLAAGSYSWHVRAVNNNNPTGCSPGALSSYSMCCAFSIPSPCPEHLGSFRVTNEFYNVIVLSAVLDGVPLAEGDSVGVYDGKLLVGKCAWSTSGDVGLSAWADDPQSQQQDGYICGHLMAFKVFDTSDCRFCSIAATFQIGNGTFCDWLYSQVTLAGPCNVPGDAPLTFEIPRFGLGVIPNPSNGTTRVDYWLRQETSVHLVVYDVSGTQIRELETARRPAGHHYVFWDVKDDHGSRVGSGIYFVKLGAKEGSLGERIVILR
jgi:parallel beta-helix repeat protein